MSRDPDMMKYIRVLWKHQDPEFPLILYSELDADRNEVRSIKVFHDGHVTYASDDDGGEADLSELPIPELAEIASDPQFEPAEITKEEFEEMWSRCA